MTHVFTKRNVLAGLVSLVALGVAVKLALALAAFAPADQPIGYVAQDEMSNYNLKSNNEVLFRSQYEREFWSGTVLAYPIDSAGNLTAGTGWWNGDAAELIDLQNFDTGRLIGTMKDDGSKIAFRYANLSAVQQAYFGADDVVVNFLRGDRSNELSNPGKTLRQRVSVLGDVVHSRPYYVADATNPTLFVGANDGMVHAINAACSASTPQRPCVASVDAGKERWAYVPSMLLPKMKKLSVDPYVHDYYVDGQINIASIASGTKRVLVGGLGGGGKGLYALDITGSAGLTASTEAEVANKVLWEITPTKLNYADPSVSNAYVNLGYTYGTPTLAKVAGTDAVIIGNGYNDGVGSYAGCTHGTPNYANCGGNYAAYLFVINASTGQRIAAIKAGVDGSAASPNGLSTPVAIDSDGDGSVDTVYAGDLNGTMWKFNLSAGTSTALLVTSPAQAITATPGIAIHPLGGYMVTFGTGKMLVPADETDATVYYAYGAWDGAPAANNALVTQTLTERSYTDGDGLTTRVRRSTSNAPVWASGAGNHKGWKVALPAGERVIGEGSFIENGRFYFTGYNPTISNTIPNTSTVVKGENWLMELDYLTGGSTNQPFLDLSKNIKLDNEDRIKYTAADVLPVTVPPTMVGDPILSTDGIPVAKFISIGVLSQPILVQLITLNDTLFNQNPDIVVPYTTPNRGVENGHFDVEIYYGQSVAGTRATATLTVGSAGQTSPYPATLGAITVNGVTVVPALTVTDLPDGAASGANALVIAGKVSNGFSAVRVGSVVTITAPVGASYNGATLSIADGSSQALVAPATVAAVAPSAGRVVITNAVDERNVSISCNGTVVANQFEVDGDNRSERLNDVFNHFNGKTVNGYRTTCTKAPLIGATTSLTCNITAPAGVSQCSAGFTVDSDLTVTTNNGPQGGSNSSTTPRSGWTNLKPALTTTAFAGGSDLTVAGDTCTGGRGNGCQFKTHVHEYDDIYDRTGVNFLRPSNVNFDLSRAIPSTSTQFKVIAQNQYLSPAVKLHIGNPSYDPVINAGYIDIKNFQTSGAALDLASVPTYTRATIGSFAFNLPADAFNTKDWWGGVNGLPADMRDGLHPTEYACATYSASIQDGNMYQPVIPPATVTATGNGTKGYSAITTQLTATGVRHNGALAFQVIKATTPNSAIEQSIPGRPEYGYRVKALEYALYVLAEYSTFHHTKHLGLCYGNTGWTKTPASDTRSCGARDTATTKKCAVELSPDAGTDPHIGNLGGGSNILDVVVRIEGNVTTTTIRYDNGLFATIVRTTNQDGSITIVTTDTGGAVTRETHANKSGSVKSGGDERGLQPRTGRISWRELVAP